MLLFVISVFPFSLAIEPSTECVLAKKACDRNEECRQASAYVHSTCITGTCAHQCATAALSLYHLPKGKELLNSDLSCVDMVAKEIKKCMLYPKGETLYCTLARLMCEEDGTCSNKLDIYTTQCDETLKSGSCSDECAQRLADVYSHSTTGPKLMKCICRSSDELCQGERNSVFNVCQRHAESIVASEENGGGIHTVNFFITAFLLSTLLVW